MIEEDFDNKVMGLNDDPLAMNIVVRDTKDFTITQLAKATAFSVASFTPLSYLDVSPSWKEWNKTNFRKILKRMKPNKFDKLSETPPKTVRSGSYSLGGVDVIVFEPLRKSREIDALKSAQVSHFTTIDEELSSATMFGVPVVTLNKDLGMSAGKASVAAAHALQKLREKMFIEGSFNNYSNREVSKNFVVRWDSIDENDESEIVIHDSGFTEVVPGSITAVAKMNGSSILR